MNSARLKLIRAHEHLETLQREIGAYNDPQSGRRITTEGNDDAYPRPVYLNIVEAPDLERWGLIVGDCVHNARSALDHVVWELSGQDIDVRDTRTEFPIFDQGKSFRGRGRGLEKIDSIKHRHREWAIVQWLQPYRRRQPMESALAIVHALDIADKHKVLAVGGIQGSSWDIDYVAQVGTDVLEFRFVLNSVAVFEHRAQIGELYLRAVRKNGSPEVDVRAHLGLDIVFGQGVPVQYRGKVVIPTLQRILECVSTIADLLVPES